MITHKDILRYIVVVPIDDGDAITFSMYIDAMPLQCDKVMWYSQNTVIHRIDDEDDLTVRVTLERV